MVNKPMKRCSTSLASKEMHIKPTNHVRIRMGKAKELSRIAGIMKNGVVTLDKLTVSHKAL